MHLLSRLSARFPDVTFIALTAALAITAGCGSSSSVATGPTPVKCGVTLAAAGGAVDSGGGTSAVTVTTQPECAWTASAEAPWITELSPESGQGNGEVRFRVTANPAAASRAGDVIVNGARARVDQAAAACRFTLGDLDGAFGQGSTSRTLTITTLTGCTWSVSTDVPWITLTPASGNGTGTITVTVAANAGGQRSGAVTVAGQTFAITQSGIAPQTCEVSATPLAQTLTATGGAGAPIAIATPATCAWTAVTSDPWIALTATSGTGPGAVTFTVTPNGGGTRGGTIRINNVTVTIGQAGTPSCTATIAPLNHSIAAEGGPGLPIAVSTSSGCRWSATSQVPWVTIVSGDSGIGNGTAQYVVAANTGSERTGMISVAGQTFTITQAAAPSPPPTSPAPPTPPPTSCTFAIAPTGHSATASGGAGPAVNVTTAASCAWTAVSNASWITLTSGTAGTGSGSVGYTVAANTEAARTGTLTIAGQTFTIAQASAAVAPCSYSVNPTTLSAPAGGGSVGPITVTTTASCPWTASSDAAWITFSSGGSGSGNASVQVSVEPNTGSARQGTLTIAGQAVTLSQAAGCMFSLANSSQSIGSGGGDGTAIGVTAPAGCTWTASSNDSWLMITSGASASGNGSVSFAATANPSAARTGTMTIAGNTYTVMQAAGCSFAISPSSQSASSSGGLGGPVSVTTTPGCTWTAASNVQWITVTSGASGSGNGSVGFNVAPNSGPARMGTLTIAGETFTVSQAAASTCTYSVNPASFSFDRKQDVGTVTITTQAGCGWTASVATGASFISLTSAALGSGNGTVSFSVAPNNGSTSSRSGSLTIAGLSVVITQSAKD